MTHAHIGITPTRACLSVCAALIAGVCWAAPARADMVQHISLEWHTVSSAHVIEATVLSSAPAHGCGRGRKLELQRTATPLKGALPERITVYWDGEQPGVGERVVAFVGHRGAGRACGYHEASGAQGTWRGDALNHVILARDGQWSAISRHAERVGGLDTLRAAIRAAAPISAPQLTPARMTWPVLEHTELAREHDVHDAVSLIVPRDAQAERELVAMLDSEVAAHRVLAAQLLVEFQSIANIERLLKLRDDPAFVMLDGERRYWVCAAAEHTLTRWRVPLPKR